MKIKTKKILAGTSSLIFLISSVTASIVLHNVYPTQSKSDYVKGDVVKTEDNISKNNS